MFMGASAALIHAQQGMPRRAAIVGGGGDRGRCTVEVVVDGVAEIDFRGDDALLRDLGGAPPHWERFECTSPIPPNAGDFRFAAIKGRGRQRLLSPPGGGGPAVVRIEDPQGGAGNYVFELSWFRGGPPPGPPMVAAPRPGGDWYHERDEWARGDDWRNRLFERVRLDIDQIQRVTWPSGGDQYRLERTKEQLNHLQANMNGGRWDPRELDEVIRSLDRVVDDNRMSPRDREVLRDDLRRLREFRDRGDRRR
jgi:hypothetical protein